MTTKPLPLAHDIRGPIGGLPVILLHGFPFDRHLWDDLFPRLAHTGFRPVAVDLPGYGDTAVPENPRSMRDTARDVLALADRLGLKRFAVVGFSMGGYVALEMADLEPERLAGLVLAATRAEPDTPENKQGRLELAAKVAKKGTAPLADAMFPRLLPTRTQKERPGLARDVRAWFERAKPEAVERTLLALAERRDLRPHLKKVAAPTLVVVGSADETMGTPPSELLAATIPGARIELFPGRGHMLMLEDPVRFHRTLLEWLQSLPA